MNHLRKSSTVIHVSIHRTTEIPHSTISMDQNLISARSKKSNCRKNTRIFTVTNDSNKSTTSFNDINNPSVDKLFKYYKRNYEQGNSKDLFETKRKNSLYRLARRPIFQYCCLFLMAVVLGTILGIILTTTTTSTMTTTEICTPFWRMPSTDAGTMFTYINANNRISNDSSRSVCVTFRANNTNTDQILLNIGSNLTTPAGGCNTHFSLAVRNNSCVTVYGMCGAYDNQNICTGKNVFYDGNFHQVCAVYDTTTTQLCIYLDLYSLQCISRTNPRYQTGLGDVRIGWWPDNNRVFTPSGGGLIKWAYLFDKVINQTCINYHYQFYFNG